MFRFRAPVLPEESLYALPASIFGGTDDNSLMPALSNKGEKNFRSTKVI